MRAGGVSRVNTLLSSVGEVITHPLYHPVGLVHP